MANAARKASATKPKADAKQVSSLIMAAPAPAKLSKQEELDAYRHVMKTAHMVIREAFSNKVITPGTTTQRLFAAADRRHGERRRHHE